MKYIGLSEHKYFSSIDDLPIYLWNKIHETGDVSFLLRIRKPISIYKKRKLSAIWKSIQDQYLKHFGLGEIMSQIISKERELILMNEDYVINNNTNQLTFIEIAEVEIAEMKKKIIHYKSDFWQTKAKLEKILGIAIDMHKISVSEYYSYFKMLSNEKE